MFSGNEFGQLYQTSECWAESRASSFEVLATLLVSSRQADLQHKDLVLDTLNRIDLTLQSLAQNQGDLSAKDSGSTWTKADADVLTRDELAQRWRVSKATIRRMEKKGEIEAMNIGNGVRITFESILAYERNAKQ